MGELWRASIEGLTGGPDDPGGSGAAQLFIGSDTDFNWIVFHFAQTASRIRTLIAKYWDAGENQWLPVPDQVDDTRGFSQNGSIHWPSFELGSTVVDSVYQKWILIEAPGEAPHTLPSIYALSAFLLDLTAESQTPTDDESNLVWLLEVDWLAGLERYATRDIAVSDVIWNGRIRGTPTVNRRLSDVGWGTVEIQDLSVSLIYAGPADDFGFLDIVLDEARGVTARLYRYDTVTSVQLLEWTGDLTSCEVLPSIVTLQGSSIDPTFFQTEIPTGESEIDADRWPLAVDLGDSIPLVLGKANFVKLPLINNDQLNSVFDYVAGYATTTVKQLYRAAPRAGKFEEINPLNDVILESVTSETNAVGTSPTSATLSIAHPGHVLPDGVLLVCVLTQGVAVASVTTNGNALSQLATRTTAGGARLELWYRLAPAPGASTILITLASITACTATALSFSHVDPTMTAPDFLATSTAVTGISGSISITKDTMDTVFAFMGVGISNVPVDVSFRSTAGREIFGIQGTSTLTFYTQFVMLGELLSVHLAGPTVASWAVNPSHPFGIIGIRLRSTPTYVISDALHTGYTVVRFSEPQTDSSDNFVEIRADLNGNMEARNFATAIKLILNDTTWGAGKTVDAATFAAVAADLDDIGELFCDGVILEKIQLQDLLAQLLPIRGFFLGRNGNGFTLTMPSEKTSVRYRMTSGGGSDLATVETAKGPSPIVAQASRRRASKTEAIKSIILKYRKDLVSSEYLVTITRPLRGFGVDKTYEMPFISVHRTADKALDFLVKAFLAADLQMGLTLAPEAMDVFEGELIEYTNANLGFDRSILQVFSVARDLTQQVIELIGWTPAGLVYNESDPFPPPDFVLGSRVDFSRIAPDPIQDFMVVAARLTGEDPDQTVSVTLRWTTPIDNYLETVIRYKESTSIGWTFGGVINTVGISTTTISGLGVDIAYDFIAFARNKFGLRSATDALIAAYTADVV